MPEQANSGDTALARLIARTKRALAGGGGGKPVKPSESPRTGNIHPHGSCARDWRTTNLSDLFAPETPDPEEKRRVGGATRRAVDDNPARRDD